MWGRYWRTADKQQVGDFFRAEPTGDSLPYAPRFNIASTTTQPVYPAVRRDQLTRDRDWHDAAFAYGAAVSKESFAD